MEDIRIFSQMQEGEPYKRYIKTILGKVFVNIVNPFSNKVEGLLLEGDPSVFDPKSYVEIWSEKEDIFFRKANRNLFDNGYLRVLDKLPNQEVQNPNILTDEEIDNLLNGKFMALKNRVDKITAEPPLFALIKRAEELGKSNKIIKFLEGRLAELQQEKYAVEET